MKSTYRTVRSHSSSWSGKCKAVQGISGGARRIISCRMFSAAVLHALTVNDQVCSGKTDSHRGKLLISVCKSVLPLDLAVKPRSCHLFCGSWVSWSCNVCITNSPAKWHFFTGMHFSLECESNININKTRDLEIIYINLLWLGFCCD